MSQLLEHILNGEYASANDLFEDKMVELQEQKLYETKRMIQAEAVGGRTIAQAIKDMQARGLTPRKASDALVDPRDRPLPPIGSKRKSPVKRKKVSEEQIDEIRLSGDVAGTLGRKIAAKGLKLGRKFLGKDFSQSYIKGRTAQISADKHDQGTNAERQAADLRKSRGVERPEDKKTPGIIRRNVNTLMGRKADYVKPETPAGEQGGRGGKVLRKAGKALGFAGRVAATMLQSAEE